MSIARELFMSGQNEEDKAKPPPEKVIEWILFLKKIIIFALLSDINHDLLYEHL